MKYKNKKIKGRFLTPAFLLFLAIVVSNPYPFRSDSSGFD